MNVNQFYALLFVFSLFGGLSFVLLVEVCKLRTASAKLAETQIKHNAAIMVALDSVDRAQAERNVNTRRIEDLQAIASVHWEAFAKVAERLKLVESSHFFLVRKPPEVAGEPGEVHPFAVDAFVTVPAGSEAAAA